MKKPDKILMTADTVGGVWTYAIDLADCLSKKGICVHLATMGAFADENQFEQAQKIKNLKLYQSNYKLEWMDNPWQDVDAAGRWLLELQEYIKPNLIHLNNYCHGHLPWKAPVLMVCHSCVLSWWQAVKKEDAPPYFKEYQQRVQAGLQAADLVVAPTQAMLNSICHIYGDLSLKKNIPNGSSIQYQNSKKEDFIFCMGRIWDEAKNISLLNKITHLVKWPILTAGDQHLQNKSTTSFSGLESLGRLSSALAIKTLEKAAIYVLPAKYEPFGLSVLEAAQASCVLVLGDIPSLKENWQDAAFFVDTDDAPALAMLLNILIEDTELRETYGKKAYKRAQDFKSSQTAHHYQMAYHQLLNETTSTSI